ncbi:unnamed protein product, partial [Larinioides sclopetarius]
MEFKSTDSNSFIPHITIAKIHDTWRKHTTLYACIKKNKNFDRLCELAKCAKKHFDGMKINS